jgi:hypothetical protein
MEAVHSSKTLVNFYQTTLCHIPEDGILSYDVIILIQLLVQTLRETEHFAVSAVTAAGGTGLTRTHILFPAISFWYAAFVNCVFSDTWEFTLH